MKKMKRYAALFLAFMMLFYVSATNQVRADYNNFYASTDGQSYKWNETSGFFVLFAPGTWTGGCSASWIQIQGANYGYLTGSGTSTISFNLTENTTTTDRVATITFYNTKFNNNDNPVTVTITQRGVNPSNVIDPITTLPTYYDFSAHQVDLYFKAETSWHITSDSSFITFNNPSGPAGTAYSYAQSVRVNIARNNTKESRIGTITISSDVFNCTKTLTVRQLGIADFYDLNPAMPSSGSTSTTVYTSGNTYYITFSASVPWQIGCDPSEATLSSVSGGTGSNVVSVNLYKTATVYLYGGQSLYTFHIVKN